MLAWPLVAFGGVYRWAAVPYLAGCGLLALARAGGIWRAPSGDRWLELSRAGLVAGTWLQLLPLPESLLARISPETLPVVDAVRLVARETTLAGVSVEPSSTVWASGILTANVLLFLAVRALFRGGGVRWSIRLIAWLGVTSATLGLAQAASGSETVYWWWEPFGEGAEPFGTFINRNHFATWVIMATPACVGYAIARLHVSASDPTHHWGSRLLSVFDGRALFLMFAGILMTVALLINLSRSGMIGLATAAVFILIASNREIDRRRRRRLGDHRGRVRRHRDLVQRFNQTVATGSGRLQIWRETLPLIGDFWATGTGAGTYQTAMLVYQKSDRLFYFNQAHNQYLQIAAEGGLLLSVPAVLALLSFVRLARGRVMGDRTAVFWIRIGAAGGLVAVMVQNLWETGLRMPANAALAAVLAAIVVHAPRHHPHRDQQPAMSVRRGTFTTGC